MKLMQKFELCYALDEDTILVPALLDTKEPPLPMPGEPGHSLDFILTYDFLPKSVISRLLSIEAFERLRNPKSFPVMPRDKVN